MAELAVLRFLELCARELGAVDAHIRIGAEPPREPLSLWHDAGNGIFVVATFSAPPADRAACEAKLSVLAGTFRTTIEEAATGLPFSGSPSEHARHRLDQELTDLAGRAGARRAAVFDVDSPVIWGASAALPSALANQELEEAVIELRERHLPPLPKVPGHTSRIALAPGSEALVRPFAGIYILALFFTGPVSEPIALGAMLHAASLIERLVLALPPIDPDPGAKIIRLRR